MTKREDAVRSVFRCETLTREIYTKLWIELIPVLDKRLRDENPKNTGGCCSVQERHDDEVRQK